MGVGKGPPVSSHVRTILPPSIRRGVPRKSLKSHLDTFFPGTSLPPANTGEVPLIWVR